MTTDPIAAIGINDVGVLWVKPATASFPFMYREAMGVHWDPDTCSLYTSKPQEWSYADWFRQIVAAAREQGVELTLADETVWSGIDPELQQAIGSIG